MEMKLHPGCGAGCLNYVKTHKICEYAHIPFGQEAVHICVLARTLQQLEQER